MRLSPYAISCGSAQETDPTKILQRAVAMLLEPIYEEQFFDFSYGLRPGRSAHQALQRIWGYTREQIMDEPIQWIVEVDIRKFFDRLITTDYEECFANGSQTE